MSSESVSIRTRLISDIEGLTAIARPPASPGERQAAEWLASRFDEINLPEEIEVFRFNADYWMVWASHGLLSAVAAAIAFAGSEAASAASLLGAATTVSFWGELTARFGLLRRLFPRRESFNVLARLRNPGAPRVLIFGAHHDAARSGPVFHPRLVAFGKGWPPPFRIPFAAMLAVTLLTLVIAVAGPSDWLRGLLLAAGALNLGFAAVLLTIGGSPVSPGANDDASGVAVLIALATRLVEDPPSDLEVWFLSTGSEEGFVGGMRAFMEKHSDELKGRSPLFVGIEMTGSGKIVYFEGEGFLRRYRYGPEAVALADGAASEPEFATVRRVKTAPFASDSLVATHFGVPAVTLASTNSAGYVPHYHWGTDIPENVDMRSVELALRFCERMVRRSSNSEDGLDRT